MGPSEPEMKTDQILVSPSHGLERKTPTFECERLDLLRAFLVGNTTPQYLDYAGTISEIKNERFPTHLYSYFFKLVLLLPLHEEKTN